MAPSTASDPRTSGCGRTSPARAIGRVSRCLRSASLCPYPANEWSRVVRVSACMDLRELSARQSTELVRVFRHLLSTDADHDGTMMCQHGHPLLQPRARKVFVTHVAHTAGQHTGGRSEERRVGEECRS